MTTNGIGAKSGIIILHVKNQRDNFDGGLNIYYYLRGPTTLKIIPSVPDARCHPNNPVARSLWGEGRNKTYA